MFDLSSPEFIKFVKLTQQSTYYNCNTGMANSVGPSPQDFICVCVCVFLCVRSLFGVTSSNAELRNYVISHNFIK